MHHHAGEARGEEWIPSDYIVVRECAVVFKLLASENETLLVW